MTRPVNKNSQAKGGSVVRAKTWSVEKIVRALQNCRTTEPDQNTSPVSNHVRFADQIPTSSTFSLSSSAGDLSIFNLTQPREFRVLESFSMSMSPSPSAPIAPIAPSHGGAYKFYRGVQGEIKHKKEELSRVQEAIWKIETQQGLQEGRNLALEEELGGLKEELRVLKADLASLAVHEAESLKVLCGVFEVKKKEIDIEFSEKLTRVKEELTDEIETSVMEMRQKDLAQKKCLQIEVSKLYGQLESKSTELNKSLATMKETHDKRVDTIREASAEKLGEILNEASDIKSRIVQKRQCQEELKETLEKDVKRATTHHDRTLDALRKKQMEKESQKQALSDQIDNIQRKIESLDYSVIKSSGSAQECDESRRKCEETYATLEAERRLLHNQLQELKGNIRVFCRVRPTSDPAIELIPIHISLPEEFNEAGKQVLTLESNVAPYDYGTVPAQSVSMRHGNSRHPNHKFQFDKIFPQGSNNSDIFLEISQLVQSSLDGFNVCVFAYGQTGSGKTWTMSHSEDGMIPLSISKIFSDIHELTTQGWEYTIDGQFVEIYNESIVDLLAPGKRDVKHEIKHDDIGKKTVITNCTTVRLETREHAIEMLEKAVLKRSTASTLVNSRSSRSHSAFILNIRGYHEVSNTTCEGTLNLIDLAGSERLNSSQARGDRLKETQAINKSLACLGDVIHCLGQKQLHNKDPNSIHVPYRNSKLTYLLKHSLGGESKTLMFVNISPNAQNANETINSLRFATKVNDTRLK